MRILALVFVVLLSGCSLFREPDLDKPLIQLPIDTPQRPQEEKVWVEAKTSRVWVNPQVDQNGDLEEGHYKDIVLVPGHWVVNGIQGNK